MEQKTKWLVACIGLIIILSIIIVLQGKAIRVMDRLEVERATSDSLRIETLKLERVGFTNKINSLEYELGVLRNMGNNLQVYNTNTNGLDDEALIKVWEKKLYEAKSKDSTGR